jgi:hypothetical protein
MTACGKLAGARFGTAGGLRTPTAQRACATFASTVLRAPTSQMLHGEKYGKDDQNGSRASFRYPLVAMAQLSAKCKTNRSKDDGAYAYGRRGTSGSGTPGSETPIPSESRLTDAHAASRPHPLATFNGVSFFE